MKKKSKRKTRQQQHAAQKFYEGINVPIVVVDLNTLHPVFINSSCEDLTGSTKSQLETRLIYDLFQKKDRKKIEAICEVLQDPQGSNEIHELDLKIVKQSGRRVSVNVSGKSVQIDQHCYMVLSLHDISMIKKYQKEREQAMREMSHVSKLADIGRLAAGVAHELNNPLMIVQGFAENIELLLQEGSPDAEELRLQIGPILKSTDRMARIISQMTRIARDDDIQLVHVDLLEIIEDVLCLVAKPMENEEIEVDKSKLEHHIVKCDPNQVEQIVLNILSNAIHALEKQDSERIIRISTRRHNSSILVRIWNNGPRIPKDIQDKIMSPFFTTKEVGKGTGLGLAVSYGIMKAHGGELKFDSSARHGTEFTLSFPVPVDIKEAVPASEKRKILVVDDEKFARQVLTNKLERFGYHVVSAGNGQEALQVLKEHLDVAAIFTDIRMPKMDGRDFIKELRQQDHHMLVYAVSGYTGTRVFEMEINRLGINGFITKPIDHNVFSRLIHKMEEHLKKQEAA